MNAFSKINMREVTRLTQAGKLTEAMALLRGHFTSDIAQASPARDRAGVAGETKRTSHRHDGPVGDRRRLDRSQPIRRSGRR